MSKKYIRGGDIHKTYRCYHGLAYSMFQVLAISSICSGLEINTTNNQILEKAVGETVKLNCPFTTTPADVGRLEIEWSVRPASSLLEATVVLGYSGGQIYDGYYRPLQGRVYFHSVDLGNGDGAIHLSLLTPTDSGIYKCQVKKVPGIQSIKTVLRVLKAPSKPRCYTEGTKAVGKTIVLHCGSQEGAVPITYLWKRTTGSKLFPTSAEMDHAAGTVTILEAIEDDAGTYLCIAFNRVGKEECFLELNIVRRWNMGVIAGAVTGILIAIGVTCSITYFVVCRLRKSELEETSNDIKEDASPPACRKSDPQKM